MRGSADNRQFVTPIPTSQKQVGLVTFKSTYQNQGHGMYASPSTERDTSARRRTGNGDSAASSALQRFYAKQNTA